MLNFFETIVEYLEIAWQYFTTLFQSIALSLTTLYTSIGIVSSAAGYVPFFISSSFVITLALVIVNYIIGRSNQ